MASLKINFTGFWPAFKPENNFIINSLKKNHEVILSDDPDFLFCSCFSDDHLEYDCVKIFYTGENLVPDFNLYDYAIGYEDINYGDRYLRFTDYAIEEEYGRDCDLMKHKHENAEASLKDKTEFCSFVVSKGSGYVAHDREELFKKISEYKTVNSGGRFLNNIGEPNGVKDKLEFQKKHKFAIACENSSHLGYRTEKIVQAFAAGCVPIYWGDPEIEKEFNGKAFINCQNYDSFDEVLEAVKKVDNDDVLYLSMLSEPALVDPDTMEKYHKNLDDFLEHIVSQESGKAFRRDLVGYNEMHKDHLLRIRRFKSGLFNRVLNKLKIGLK